MASASQRQARLQRRPQLDGRGWRCTPPCARPPAPPHLVCSHARGLWGGAGGVLKPPPAREGGVGGRDRRPRPPAPNRGRAGRSGSTPNPTSARPPPPAPPTWPAVRAAGARWRGCAPLLRSLVLVGACSGTGISGCGGGWGGPRSRRGACGGSGKTCRLRRPPPFSRPLPRPPVCSSLPAPARWATGASQAAQPAGGDQPAGASGACLGAMVGRVGRCGSGHDGLEAAGGPGSARRHARAARINCAPLPPPRAGTARAADPRWRALVQAGAGWRRRHGWVWAWGRVAVGRRLITVVESRPAPPAARRRQDHVCQAPLDWRV